MKSKRSLVIPALGLLLGVAAFCAPSASADVTTVITTAPYTITKPGKYRLGADLVYAGDIAINDSIIMIAASNVTLDFAGHYISGPSGAPNTRVHGIFAYERGNINILGGTIAFCDIGVYLSGNGGTASVNINQHIEDMLITSCYYSGVYLDSARNSEVRDCRIANIGGWANSNDAYGIYSTGVTVKVADSAITTVNAKSGGSSYGIYGSATTISVNNTVADCKYGILGGKYQFNLTFGCTLPYSGGTDASFNN